METLLPSEIARLVYGYLIEERCNDAANNFLETSEHMRECLTVSRNGKKFQTKFEGKNLVDILELLSQLKAQAQTVVTRMPKSLLLNENLKELLILLEVQIPSSTEVENCLPQEDAEEVSSANETTDEFDQSEAKSGELKDKNSLPPSPEVVESPPDSSLDVTNSLEPTSILSVDNTLPSTSQSTCSQNQTSLDLCADAPNAPLHESRVDEGSSKSSDTCDDCEIIPRPDSSSKHPTIDPEVVESDVVCLSPEADVIEIEEDEPEEVSQTNGSSESALMNIINQSGSKSDRRRGRKRRFRSSSGFPLRSETFKSPRKGLDSLLGRSRQNPLLRITPHVSNTQPSTSSTNYGWIGKTSNVLPRSTLHPPGPVLVNQRVMETSSFGFPQRRSSLPHQGGVQIISEELVTQMVNNSQPVVSHSVVSNRTLIAPAVPAAPIHQNNLPLINQIGYIL